MGCKRRVVIGIVASVTGTAVGQQATYLGVIRDEVVRDYPSVYRAAPTAAGAARPFPAIDQIPPIAMPANRGWRCNPDASGFVLYHNALTGETRVAADGSGWAPGGGQTGGFSGLDGGGGGEGGLSLDFSDLTLVPAEDRDEFPWRVHARAIIRRGQVYTGCSATLIDAEVALLAGHCIYNFGGSGWADEVFIIPGWDGTGESRPPDPVLNPYGWASGTEYLVGGEWVEHGDDDFDMGAVKLTRAAGMLTGWFGHAWGGTCQEIQNRTYHSAGYPNDPGSCPLYDGTGMYYWFGTFDSCPGNRLVINSTGTCQNDNWPGMSGGSAYYIDGSSRFAHAVATGPSPARFCKMWLVFAGGLGQLIDSARGNVLDIQPLDCRGSKAAVEPGELISMTHLATNPTNFDPVGKHTYTFTWYLSSDESIETSDTPLTTRSVLIDFAAMGAATFVSNWVQIPANTPPGTYWLGVIFDPATDSVPENNDSSLWDAHELVVMP